MADRATKGLGTETIDDSPLTSILIVSRAVLPEVHIENGRGNAGTTLRLLWRRPVLRVDGGGLR